LRIFREWNVGGGSGSVMLNFGVGIKRGEDSVEHVGHPGALRSWNVAWHDLFKKSWEIRDKPKISIVGFFDQFFSHEASN